MSQPAELDPLAQAVAGAQAAGVDVSQIGVFADGAVTYEEYESAMMAYLTCVEGAGFRTAVDGLRDWDGLTVLDYVVFRGGNQALDWATSDRCYKEFAQYVDAYWQARTPESIAASGRRATDVTPQLLGCLEDYGASVPAGASFAGLTVWSTKLAEEDPSRNCMVDLGYDSWTRPRLTLADLGAQALEGLVGTGEPCGEFPPVPSQVSFFCWDAGESRYSLELPLQLQQGSYAVILVCDGGGVEMELTSASQPFAPLQLMCADVPGVIVGKVGTVTTIGISIWTLRVHPVGEGGLSGFVVAVP